MREKLAFIDHSFHQKTGATKFLIDILMEQYDITFFWDESWNGGNPVDLRLIAKQNFQKILFFQIIHYPERELNHLRDNNVIVCPMYDASPHQSTSYWNKFRLIPKIKFINFSHSLHEKFTRMEFTTLYVQYFILPEEQTRNNINNHSLKGFFWQRTNQITWKNIKKLIKNSSFESFHIHAATDPPGFRFVKPSPKEIETYHIQTSKWFDNKNDLMKVINDSNVFFASRFNEGIGHSFLEAMARGKCVVAPDRPTMNEYIRHRETGVLYNPLKPQPLDLTNISSIGRNARQYINKGYQSWNEQKHQILEFINSPSRIDNLTQTYTLKKKRWEFLSYWNFKMKQRIKKKFPKTIKYLYWIRKRYR